jgi:hypothetical protein
MVLMILGQFVTHVLSVVGGVHASIFYSSDNAEEAALSA